MTPRTRATLETEIGIAQAHVAVAWARWQEHNEKLYALKKEHAAVIEQERRAQTALAELTPDDGAPIWAVFKLIARNHQGAVYQRECSPTTKAQALETLEVLQMCYEGVFEVDTIVFWREVMRKGE